MLPRESGWCRACSEPRHDRLGEVLDHAVLPVERRVEHDLLESLLRERAHAIHDLFGRAGEADGLDESGRDEARLDGIEEAIVAAVQSLMPLGGRRLLEPGEIALPDRPRVFRR